MSYLKHESADGKHYDTESESYDSVNEVNSIPINKVVHEILKKHKVKTVADFTCGTGSQVFYLNEKGYEISGYDISKKMLTIARMKAKKLSLNLKFKNDDIRTVQAGRFDAVISIFNAIGHLTKKDFKKAIKNIAENLNPGGIYMFDNFNLNYLRHGNNICTLTMDVQHKVENKTFREIQYSTIDSKGVLASFDTYINCVENRKPKVINAQQTLQTYSADELKEILFGEGFKVVKTCNPDGTKFSDIKSERILVVAKKQ